MFVPPKAFRRIPPDQPKPHQAPRDMGRFGWTAARNEPRQCAAIVLEIVMHAIQPSDLRWTNQPVRDERGFTGAVTHQSLHGSVLLTGRGELEGRIGPHGFEHLVQRARGHRGRGSQQEAFVDQPGDRAERLIARRLTLTTREDGRRGLHRKATRQSAETTERVTFVRTKQLIAPRDRRIHRLLALREIARADG